jgi:hypothetical protein
MKRIICCRFGDKFTQWHVDNLKHMIDTYSGIKYDEFVVIEEDLYGNWYNKFQMYDKFRDGENLYFDLDVVITDNIDSFFTYEEDSKVVLMRDFNLTTQGFNSSIMRFNNEVMTPCVWDLYQSEKKKFDRLQGDQNVITDCIKQVPDKFKIYPDEWTFSAKWYDRYNPRFKRSQWNFKQYPGAKVAVFHGKPDPLQLADPHPHESYDMDTIAWVKNHWK